MCFRPAEVGGASKPVKCPECGKAIEPMGGVELKTCPFCHCDFTAYLDEKPIEKPSFPSTIPGAPVMANSPSTPKGSGATGATKTGSYVPSMPGAPKAPSAPSAPKAPGA